MGKYVVLAVLLLYYGVFELPRTAKRYQRTKDKLDLVEMVGMILLFVGVVCYAAASLFDGLL